MQVNIHFLDDKMIFTILYFHAKMAYIYKFLPTLRYVYLIIYAKSVVIWVFPQLRYNQI